MGYQRALKALKLQKTDKILLFGAIDDGKMVEKVHRVRIPDGRHIKDHLFELCRVEDVDLIRGVLKTRWPKPPSDTTYGTFDELKQYFGDIVDKSVWAIACKGCILGKTSMRGIWPFVVKRPFETYEELVNYLRRYDPRDDDTATSHELIGSYEKGYSKLQNLLGDLTLVMSGLWKPYLTLFTYLIEHIGWPLLARLASQNAELLDELISNYAEVTAKRFEAWSRIDGIKAIEVHDDIATEHGPVFSPSWFREKIFPYYKNVLWRPLKNRGIKIIFVSDGNYVPLMDGLSEAGADGFIIEWDPKLSRRALEGVVEKYGDKKVILTAPNWDAMMDGTVEDIRSEAEWISSLAKKCPAFFLFSAQVLENAKHRNRTVFYKTWLENRPR